MRIGEIARLAGSSPKGVRLYEAKGLLGQVSRDGAYRRYGAQDLARVRLIKQAQALGFRLSELTALDALDTAEGWEHIAMLLRNRRAAVALEQQRLAVLDAQLADLEAELRGCSTAPAAQVLQECGNA
jgi:MerR family copper efflux transcriptional regulator